MTPIIEWLGRFPVRVRRGHARGAWWPVYRLLPLPAADGRPLAETHFGELPSLPDA